MQSILVYFPLVIIIELSSYIQSKRFIPSVGFFKYMACHTCVHACTARVDCTALFELHAKLMKMLKIMSSYYNLLKISFFIAYLVKIGQGLKKIFYICISHYKSAH